MAQIDVLIQYEGEEPMQVIFEDDTGYDEADEDDDVFWYGTPTVESEYGGDGWRVLKVYAKPLMHDDCPNCGGHDKDTFIGFDWHDCHAGNGKCGHI